MTTHDREAPLHGAPSSLRITLDTAGQRLDRYLASILHDRSRTAIQQLIAVGDILVNGRSSKPGYMLRAGDEILVTHLHVKADFSHIQPLALPLDIVYEDQDILIVNKPAGMIVHPAPGHRDDTLVNALLAHVPSIQEAGSNARPGIVHRLDKDTSGLLIVAKSARAHAALVEQMKRHEVIKRYLALVEGVVSLDQGSIDAPIGRDPRNRQQMAITSISSREARTHFRVIERFARHTLLLLQLETGRTHQIRLHLKAIGHPVVGDRTYGSGHSNERIAVPRQFLHAYQLSFAHPISGAKLEFEASLPPDLQVVLDAKSFL